MLRRHFKGSCAWVAFNHLDAPDFCAFASLNLAWRTLPPFFFLVPVVQQTLVRIVYNPILQYNLYPLQYFLFGTYCNYCMSKSYASAFMPMTPYSGLVEPGPQIEKQALEQGTRLGRLAAFRLKSGCAELLNSNTGWYSTELRGTYIGFSCIT